MEQTATDTRTRIIKRASVVGMTVNTVLAALKVGVGLFSGSLALVADGFDSATDVLTSLISLVAARFMSAPPDAEHPYGHGKAEQIAGKLISFIIFSVGLQIALTSISNLRSGNDSPLSVAAVFAAAVSIAGKLFLWLYKYRLAQKTKSVLLMADAKNMRSDVVLSAAVLAALAAERLFALPMLDSVAALAVSVWIMVVAFNLFREISVELMDGHSDMEDYRSVIAAVSDVDGVANPHKIRIRKVGEMFFVDLDIEVDGRLTVAAGHRIAMEVEAAVRDSLENTADVMVHVEPKGSCEEEPFGLSEKNLEEEERKAGRRGSPA